MNLKSITFIPVMDWTAECETNPNLINIPCDGCGKDCEVESSKYESKTIKGDSYTLNQYHCTECFVERWKKYRK